MQLSEDVRQFGKSCEHIVASIATHRPLTEDEKRFIAYYCNEVLNVVTESGSTSKSVIHPSNSHLSSDASTSE